jgi:hypothetical protein
MGVMLDGMHSPKVSQCKDITRDRANGAAVTIESLAAAFFLHKGKKLQCIRCL